MLNLENKILLAFLLILIVISCDDEKNNNKSIDEIYYKKSMSIVDAIDSKNYYKIYNSASDSINSWLIKLTSYDFLKSGAWELDSLLCFDKDAQRCVMCIKSKCETDKNCNSENIHFFLGKIINGNWYFFQESASVVLPRRMYQKDIHTPLTFEKMHEIALIEIFGGYLTPEGEINENFFKQEFEGSGWGVSSGKKEDFEKIYLEKVNNNWYWHSKDTTKKELLP